jgi:deoxyribodipyrimidine photo-lyase
MSAGNNEIVIFWFRRDIRLEDNCGLWHALSSGYRVVPLFIYDENILNKLDPDDRRMSFLKDLLSRLYSTLKKYGSSLVTLKGTPLSVFITLIEKFTIKGVYFNGDYEPYATRRDSEVKSFFSSHGIPCFSFKDQVIFEMSEVVKNDGKPYTVYTPYSARWLTRFSAEMTRSFPSEKLISSFIKTTANEFYTPEKLGFHCPPVLVKHPLLTHNHIINYHNTRDFPSLEGTSFLGPHLRFGTISIREVIRQTMGLNLVFLKELIWREFFTQILYHFPLVSEKSFRPGYDKINWINNEEHFESWCRGKTGYPIVDAGMRELNSTGYMHNRVRMIAAGFLTKHLLTDWRWGEAYFASKLLDFELSSNNGNWQWAAGSGCDAAPYFRVFNPQIQLKKFDRNSEYVKKWVPEYGTLDYPAPIIDHKFASRRAIEHYQSGLNK